MKKNRWVAVLAAFCMVLSLLPLSVFAEEVSTVTLGGKVKVKGAAAVGSVLEADLTQIVPEGITSEDVSCLWLRKEETGLTELALSVSYVPAEADLGYPLVLRVTGLPE